MASHGDEGLLHVACDQLHAPRETVHTSTGFDRCAVRSTGP